MDNVIENLGCPRRARCRTGRSYWCCKAAARSAPITPASITPCIEHGVEPDWIIGTSIGAINASLIAGNPRDRRLDALKEFWTADGVSSALRACRPGPACRTRSPIGRRLLRGIPDFFKPNPGAFLGTHVPLGVDNAGFYSTAPLEKTLLELVDFKLVNTCTPRLTVGAAHVRTSAMKYFDSRDGEIGVKHILASGALPPAFPAVRIDGELYWDGGILSNTPTEAIFDDNPRKNSLIFAAHLWNPMGNEPRTIWEVLNRQKDIQYSSRVASHIARQRQMHRLRHIINDLREAVAGRCAPAAAGARTHRLWLPDHDACGASARAADRERESHQGCRFQPVQPSASAGRPATPTPRARSNRRRGRANSIRSKA